MAIKQLEQTIDDIEAGNIDLEQALNKYKEGVNLVKFCQEKLQDIEQKIKILDQDSNQLKDFATQ
ncbi:exodeoxyribonuclease VII small subunit [Aquella oligotrophica]|uniref:Exodeoxyribonuclease VII small subunit n=2 Tax=Aquella oligotrophica TaxID=2067065 RepID=A0A2I7N9K4_9NEIS|nr:exodeoxyribonuclease VII small subunit [Aquella oligotrophica]